ncbi:Hypothetical protein SMAX5B_005028, partial [Scophthalmus maximus]
AFAIRGRHWRCFPSEQVHAMGRRAAGDMNNVMEQSVTCRYSKNIFVYIRVHTSPDTRAFASLLLNVQIHAGAI